MNWIKKNVAKLIAKFQLEYKFDFVEEIPLSVKDNTIYIVGAVNQPWLLAFKCPCGCQSLIQLNLLTNANPCWDFWIDKKNKISISPSIWRTIGCKSHFLIKKSKVDWVRFPVRNSFFRGI